MSLSHDAPRHGFSPLAIARIEGARRANKIAIYLIYAAIAAFVVFGTIASLQSFHSSDVLYQLFYYLPYLLIALTIPLTVYDALVLYRYRLSQPSMIALSVGVSTVLLIGGLLFASTAWLGLASWLGVAFLFQANFRRFFKFLAADDVANDDATAQ
ncbi:hypothetical protein [Psychrobacter aestuarii]|uniref:Uncharacterized protein n=1 Tax=Psychrobacter aestuarii TaxID=556327 RepID=A0ABN0W348_9GAMM|nr:hypothetical protein [Psychrobacter aestuarii]